MRRACPQVDGGTRLHRHRLVSHEPCRSLDTPSVEKELARAGWRPRRATAGCSFGTRRGSPASDTLGPRRGAMQGSSAARITRTANADGRAATVGLARHGTYARKTPRGTQIARWYCPESHTTFSLLPDCLAARLPGELDTLEAVVAHAERAASVSAAGQCVAPRPGRARGRDTLGPAPGAAGPCRPGPRHRPAPRAARAMRRRGGRGAHPARNRQRPGRDTRTERRATPRAARPVGVPPPPSRLDDSQSALPTQDGA